MSGVTRFSFCSASCWFQVGAVLGSRRPHLARRSSRKAKKKKNDEKKIFFFFADSVGLRLELTLALCRIALALLLTVASATVNPGDLVDLLGDLSQFSARNVFSQLGPEQIQEFLQLLAAQAGDPQAAGNIGDVFQNALNRKKRNEAFSAHANGKRSIIPGVLDDLLQPGRNLLEFLFGPASGTPPTLERTLLARAPVLQCVNDEDESFEAKTCKVDEIPKRPGSYVWDIARSGNKVFFSTVNDVFCKILGEIGGALGGGPIDPDSTDVDCSGDDEAFANEKIYMVEMLDCCTHGPVQDITPTVAQFPNLNPELTELRALGCVENPFIHGSRKRSHHSDSGSDDSETPETPTWFGDATRFCVGIAAEYIPSLVDSVQVFVFDGDTGATLAVETVSAFKQARSAATVGSRLFFGAQLAGNDAWGGVIEWKPTVDQPIAFDVVGDFTEVAGAGAEVVEHQGRLFVTTWPTIDSTLTSPNPAIRLNGILNARGGKLLSSPPLADVSEDTSHLWTVEWDACEYDPNPITCRITRGGAIVSHNDQLTWGTMHLFIADIPVVLGLCSAIPAVLSVEICDTPVPASEHWFQPAGVLNACDFCAAVNSGGAGLVLGLVSAVRATSVFRGTNLGRGSEERQKIEILYGYPVFITPGGGPLPVVPNIFPRPAPVFGLAGFGNIFAGYTWSAAAHDGDAFFGTFDFSGIINDLLNPLIGEFLPIFLELGTPGADLVRIGQTRLDTESTKFETLTGFDNDRNYGFRTLLSMPCGKGGNKEQLIVGSANPYSIHPQGGWFLHCLHKKQ